MQTAQTSVLSRAFALLESLAQGGGEMSLGDAATAAALPAPTAHRMLRELKGLGYVSQHQNSRKYALGSRFSRFREGGSPEEIRRRGKRALETVHRTFNETVNLGMLEGADVVYLDFLETTKPLRWVVRPGASDPAYCTALGRAVLSQMPSAALRELLNSVTLERVTPKTVTSKKRLAELLDQARSRGWNVEFEECAEGVACVSAPLVATGLPDAAISVSVPVARFSPRLQTRLIAALLKAATQYRDGR